MGYFPQIFVVAALCVVSSLGNYHSVVTDHRTNSITYFLMSSNPGLVSIQEFRNALTINGYPLPTDIQYTTFVQGLSYGSITNTQEAAMALTQFMHESGGLRYRREHICEFDGCPEHYRTPGVNKFFYYRSPHPFTKNYYFKVVMLLVNSTLAEDIFN